MDARRRKEEELRDRKKELEFVLTYCDDENVLVELLDVEDKLKKLYARK